MKLAYSTNGFTQRPLIQAIEEIAQLGYPAVEILADAPHAFPPSKDAPWVPDVIKVLDRLGMEVSNINGNTAIGFFREHTGQISFEPSLCNASQEVRARRLAYTKGCIDFAHTIGASNISITSGMCLPGNPPPSAWGHFLAALTEIMDYAEKKSINVGIECEPGLLVENGDELLEIIRAVGSTRLGANLDLGHAEVGREDIDALLRKLGPRIWNIHLEDIRDRKHYHLIPGEGTMNFAEIMDTLQDIGYERFITIELYTYAHNDVNAAKRSFAYLQPMLKEVMQSEIF
ncbi:sugar phosphate isomerase/epimerase family protein [Paenibacillus xerothermodurans]|uniref:Sugar phosphate isomerase/epimerase n=1 Tax=Paenibacillus xerothermodurans TaxID=1977292 RepID=A0A2W1N6J7_PAEXE|nr:sugar phosphate isomerase/epimerase [Paenibacillus xerothermodurans]PZE20017.1 sugar phosphate isomerase/epimerase [Paenibacillus xerothermodurans]